MDFQIFVGNGVYAFTGKFELDRCYPIESDGLSLLQIDGLTLQGVENQFFSQGYSLSLISMSGTLLNAIHPNLNSRRYFGASLLNSDGLPFTIDRAASSGMHSLLFNFTSGFIMQLEEARLQKGRKESVYIDLQLGGVAAITPNSDSSSQTPDRKAAFIPWYTNGQIRIRISQSDWIDTYLPKWGYPHRRLIEVPSLASEDAPEEMQLALQHLVEARRLFDQEDYRACTNRCRQVRDALLAPSKTTWSKTYLEPIVGEQKAEMVNLSIKALEQVDQKGSHGDNAVEIDRESARFMLFALENALNYIALKVR